MSIAEKTDTTTFDALWTTIVALRAAMDSALAAWRETLASDPKATGDFNGETMPLYRRADKIRMSACTAIDNAVRARYEWEEAGHPVPSICDDEYEVNENTEITQNRVDSDIDEARTMVNLVSRSLSHYAYA